MPANPHGGVFPPGLATGIGSLPFRDAAEAAELVLRVHPDLPCVPQLGVPREGVVAQWAGVLPEITTEQWLLVHRDLRALPRVRAVMDALVELFQRHRYLLEGRS